MSFTAYQKKYIKKNYKKFSPAEMALDLGISEKEIGKFLKKRGLEVNDIHKISKAFEVEPEQVYENFRFNKFFAENIWIFVGLFLLIFIVYFNALNNAFVSDDIGAILNNKDIGNWSNVFTGTIKFNLQSFLYFLAYHIGGLNPISFRLLPFLFHIGSTALFFLLVSLLINKRIAIFAALIFAVHPILTESVTWISGMPYALSGFFVLLSFILYILAKDKKSKLIISLALFLLALISSEKTMPFPAILFLYELAFSDLKKNWKKLIPYFSLSAIWALIYISRIGQRTEALQNQYYQPGGVDNPLIQIPIAIFNYLKLIFWPKSLTLYHTDLTVGWGTYYVILALFLIFVGAIVYSYKKNKQIFFWLMFFIITLLPTLTPLKISWVVAERYVYLGSLGVFVVIAMFFDWLAEKEKWKPFAYTLFAIIILSLSVRTIIRNIDWKNEDNLWIATARVSEAGPNIHNNLGDVYTRQGNFEKAAEEFKKAVEINPRYADAEHNLGLTYIQMGKAEEAISTFKTAVSMNPNIWQSYQMMASIYFDQQKYDLALESIKKALAINPNDHQLQENLKTIEAKN